MSLERYHSDMEVIDPYEIPYPTLHRLIFRFPARFVDEGMGSNREIVAKPSPIRILYSDSELPPHICWFPGRGLILRSDGFWAEIVNRDQAIILARRLKFRQWERVPTAGEWYTLANRATEHFPINVVYFPPQSQNSIRRFFE
ncbi:hypothetical protein ACFLZP_03440 [Patescibacteria group bacterium]